MFRILTDALLLAVRYEAPAAKRPAVAEWPAGEPRTLPRVKRRL